MAGHAVHPASRLQEVLLETTGLEEFLHELSAVAARSLGDRAVVGVTVVREGAPRTAAGSAARAAALDELQYEHGNGPCLTALRTGAPVEVPDLGRDDRFSGDYRTAAAREGIRAVLAVPFAGGPRTGGVLNAYFEDALPPGSAELDALAGFAQEAARALALAIRIVTEQERTEQLYEAMASRRTIDQAIGIVMAQRRCTPEEAFATLRQASQNRNVKLRTVAQEVVARVAGGRRQQH